jgi:hypothetical protein
MINGIDDALERIRRMIATYKAKFLSITPRRNPTH